MKVALVCLVSFCAAVAFIHAQDAPTTGAICGQVLGQEQEIVGDAQIEVVSGPSSVGSTVKSRGPNSVAYDGGFFIPRLLPGTFTVKVSHKKYISQTRENIKVAAGEGTFVVVELQRKEDVAGSITGIVSLRSSGASVKGLVVGYLKKDEKKPEQTFKLDKDGRYSFKDVMPGPYFVTVTRDREEIYRSKQIKVTKKRTTRHSIRLSPEALLEKPGWISGKVVGPDRKPVDRASISLIKMPAGQKKVRATTDKDGKFEMKGLRPGSYELKASKARLGDDTAKTNVRSNRGSRVSFNLKKK